MTDQQFAQVERFESGLDLKAQRFDTACNVSSSAGLTTIIAAPPTDRQIVIVNLCVQNETDTAQVLTLMNTAGVWLLRIAAPLTGRGISRVKWYRTVGPGQALKINAAAAAQYNWSIDYYVETV
jgi:hypothetical protein